MLENKAFATDFNKIVLAKGWTSATKGTVDLFSRHASKKKNGIPANRQGKQIISDSANYAGIIAYSDPKEKKGYSEYLQGELISVLEKGKTYHVSFKVSLSEKSTRAVAGLGAVFSSTQIKERHVSILKILPSIQTTDIISDTKDWTEIEGEYTAKGGEKWIIIGLFGGNMNAVNVKKDLKYKENRAYYYVSEVSVYLKEAQNAIIEPVLSLQETQVLEKAVYGIQFETDKDVILDSSIAILNQMVKILKNNTQYLLTIEGHTDSDGDELHNIELSQKRAIAVKEYLVQNGVEEGRISTFGYGAKFPKEDNSTLNGKAINRRVEFKIKY